MSRHALSTGGLCSYFCPFSRKATQMMPQDTALDDVSTGPRRQTPTPFAHFAALGLHWVQTRDNRTAAVRGCYMLGVAQAISHRASQLAVHGI